MNIFEAHRKMDMGRGIDIAVHLPKSLNGQRRRNPEVVREFLDQLALSPFLHEGSLSQTNDPPQPFEISTHILHAAPVVDEVVGKVNDVRRYLSKALYGRAPVNHLHFSSSVLIATVAEDMQKYLMGVYARRVGALLDPAEQPGLEEISQILIQFISNVFGEIEVIDWAQPDGWGKDLVQYIQKFRHCPESDVLSAA